MSSRLFLTVTNIVNSYITKAATELICSARHDKWKCMFFYPPPIWSFLFIGRFPASKGQWTF